MLQEKWGVQAPELCRQLRVKGETQNSAKAEAAAQGRQRGRVGKNGLKLPDPVRL